jgi:hypothetical protein
MGEWRDISTILNLDIRERSGGQLQASPLSPGKQHPVPTGKEAGRTREVVWKL